MDPEEALAALMQVKPEGKETTMPKYKHEDRVRIIAGEYDGKTGAIFGSPTMVIGRAPASEEQRLYEYDVDLDNSPDTVSVMESNLESI